MLRFSYISSHSGNLLIAQDFNANTRYQSVLVNPRANLAYHFIKN